MRKVRFKTIYDLIRKRPLHFRIGIMFISIPILVGGIIISVFSFLDSDTPEADYNLINENGLTTDAIITNIITQDNITINEKHPSIISYTYKAEDKTVDSKYKVLDPIKVQKLNVGDTIRVKYLGNSSIITELESASFSLRTLYVGLAALIFIGVVILILLYLRIKKEINLYKNGRVCEAEIISLRPKYSWGQNITVYYRYKTSINRDVIGKSATTDFSFLNKKQGEVIKIFVSHDNESESCVISKLDEVRNNWQI